MSTFSELINKCLVELRQEVGISVQQYSEDVLAAILQRQFNVFFDHYWWPTYLQGGTFTLSGTDGRVVEDLREKIKRIDDIRYIWLENEPNPIPMHPPALNPFANKGRPYWYPDGMGSTSLFWISPPTTTGKVNIIYRTKPAPFKPNDEVMIDDDLLVCATCANYLADDEDAPNSIKKFMEATAKREAQLREVLNRGPMPIGAASPSPFTDWMMSP